MENIKQEIISFLDSFAQEQVQFVFDVCDQNSYTYNKKGVDRVAEMFVNKLNGILPFHEVFEQGEIGNHHLLKTKDTAEAVYLVGHLDTVFPTDHSFQKCRFDGDLLIGPGTGDMKGGLAVIVYALKALNEVNFLHKLPIAVIFNSDEEIGSITSQEIYKKEKSKAIACFVAECAGLNGEIVVSRNGKIGARINSYGKDRHVAFGSHKKSSAVLELAHKIIEVESLNASQPGVSINVGKIEGGLGASTIPAQAFCLMDIRWANEDHNEALVDNVRNIVAENSLPRCRSELKILNSRPAMPINNGTKKLFKIVEQVGKYLGQDIISEHRRGTSDANFFGSAGVPTLDGWGPICDNDHTPNEYIKISSLKERTALLALFLLEYGQKLGKIS